MVLHESENYSITAVFSNAVIVTNKTENKSVLMQGDDCCAFIADYDQISDEKEFDVLCSQYDDVMTPNE